MKTFLVYFLTFSIIFYLFFVKLTQFFYTKKDLTALHNLQSNPFSLIIYMMIPTDCYNLSNSSITLFLSPDILTFPQSLSAHHYQCRHEVLLPPDFFHGLLLHFPPVAMPLTLS